MAIISGSSESLVSGGWIVIGLCAAATVELLASCLIVPIFRGSLRVLFPILGHVVVF